MRDSTAAAAAMAFTSSPLMPIPVGSTDMRAWGTQMRYQAVSLPRTCEIVGQRANSALVEVPDEQLPPWLVPIALAGLFVGGAVARGWIGAAALFLVAAFIAWLASLSWPALRPPGRLLRVLIVALLIAFALWQGSR